ncbi:MAG: hypothetical protein US50_C0002G0025 [Candidatus Nomurabacteria bacterium GW2011_GWB1_37_5]|uniref:Uncharacterized protein n=1 Tax=Candidatus Nomurabacteria bacterium GW2011_GWB1_37_5 TaxID=1618742 RepID=A0A0G0HBN5_9BACT|nr:MAG: hypothetical protein US50_C0002G0025 [Candidatus Nomurabacteria bacterium GW2011_GWB1_37_5]
MNWKTIEWPGYLGKHRDTKYKRWNNQYGQGNWRLAWKIGPIYVGFSEACALYEDAYFEFLKKEQVILKQLVAVASNVYDDSLTNVDSGFDYSKQETGRTHVQDIAIRRSLLRLGIWFEGKNLIQIRDSLGIHTLSMQLSPGRVPFHKLDLIIKPEIEPKWWKLGSVESFYQSNKFLQILEK